MSEISRFTERTVDGIVRLIGGGIRWRYVETDKLQKAIDQLADYEDAEEQGLLIKLPCKTGTNVYVVTSKLLEDYDICDGLQNKLFIEATVSYFNLVDNDVTAVLTLECSNCDEPCNLSFDVSEFGKNIFFKADKAAQKALTHD